MKLVVTSDAHIHNHRVGSIDGRGLDRLADGLSALDQTLAFARDHQAVWVFLGDLKTPKSIWPLDALNGVRATLVRYADVHKVAVPGNHDTVSGPFGSGLEPLREFMTIYDTPTVGQWEDERTPKKVRPRDVVTVAAWPWGAGHRDALPAFLDEAAQTRKEGPVVLLAHLMLAGVHLGPTDVQRPDKGLPLDAFRPGQAFDVGLFGDVHKGQTYRGGWRTYADMVSQVEQAPRKARQRAQAGPGATNGQGGAIPLRAPGPWRGEVFVPGSPYQQSFGERDDGPKGALLVDVATGRVDLLPVTAPRFREVEVATWDELDGLRLKIDDGREAWQDDVVRLFVPAGVLATKGVTALVEEIRKASAARLLTTVPRCDVVVAHRAPVHGGMTPQELVRAYAGSKPLEGIDPAVVERAGLELLVEKDEGDDRVG